MNYTGRSYCDETAARTEYLIPTWWLVQSFHTYNHFYLPTNALNCIKFRRLKSICINILKDN